MNFPKRTKQQKSEANSYAILLYKLRDLGIFRNLTDNDYGIDFELELVQNNQVTAQSVKIQVKSAETLKLRENQSPSVGGIKQTTLNYWCELSYHTNVIAYAVDLTSETIYVSNNLFWQATRLIDGSSSSKSIEFLPAGKDGDITAKTATLDGALAPNAADHVYAHTLALRRLKDFIDLLADAYHYDPGTSVEGTHFRDLLETSRILLWGKGDSLWNDENDKKGWENYEYWEKKSESAGWDGLSCYAAKPILSVLVPALVQALKKNRETVFARKYYWAHRNPQFLKLVFVTTLPENHEKEALITWGEQYESNSHVTSASACHFVEHARKPKPSKIKKSTKREM